MMPRFIPTALFLAALPLFAGNAKAVVAPPPPEASPQDEALQSDVDQAFDQLSRHHKKDARYYAGYGLTAQMPLGTTNKATREFNPLAWLGTAFAAIDRSQLRVMADYAAVSPLSGTFSYVGRGSQTGLVSLVPAMKFEQSTFAIGMAYHYASFYDNLPPRIQGGHAWHAIVNRHDFSLLGEYDYQLQSGLALFAGAGASLQRRILVLYSEHDYSADDYYANFTYGYEGSVGAEWHAPFWDHDFFMRLFCRYISGSRLATEHLNYDNTKANLNFAAYATGVAAGYAF